MNIAVVVIIVSELLKDEAKSIFKFFYRFSNFISA